MTRDEIIKALRHCASVKDCRECVLASLKVSTGRCERILQNAAADMLEQDAPGWNSVEDRLPMNEEPVLIAIKWKFANSHGIACSMAFHTDGKTFTGDSSFCWNRDGTDDLVYDEDYGEWIIPEGWWEYVRYGEQFSAVDEPIVAWMPLPEPPKEDKK